MQFIAIHILSHCPPQTKVGIVIEWCSLLRSPSCLLWSNMNFTKNLNAVLLELFTWIFIGIINALSIPFGSQEVYKIKHKLESIVLKLTAQSSILKLANHYNYSFLICYTPIEIVLKSTCTHKL